ncbi:MAG: PfkB family carbohydrate kinase [Bacteroidota bacterium]|nr:PfkB family carbohydrate kinase [Bacteroidota bacterium]
MQGYFLSIGELLADIISVDYSESLQQAKTFEMYQGGSPANVAANIKFLGKDVELVSCVGNDGIGKFLTHTLTSIGISTNHIQVSNEHATTIILVSKSKATPDFISYREADFQLHAVEKTLINNAGIIHTTAFALSKQPARGVIIDALHFATEQNKIVSIDWNFAPIIWGSDNGATIFETIIRMKPLLKISVDDLERFVRKTLCIDDCKSFLDKYSTTATCLTCGKDGVWYKELNAGWQFKNARRVSNVIDTTGAGDAFWAGFCVAYLEDLHVSDCIENGLEIAARKIQKSGPLYL